MVGLNSQDRPRVWAVSTYYYPNFSGAAIQAHRILKGLAKAGFGVAVFTAADNDARNSAGQRRQLDDVDIEYVPVVRRHRWAVLSKLPPLQSRIRDLNQAISDVSLNLRIAWRIWRQCRVGDILQLYSLGAFTILPLCIARRKNMRIVVQISLMGADDPMSFHRGWFGLTRAIKLQCLRGSNLVIALSTALRVSCLQAGLDPDKVVRIPNGVDVSLYHPCDGERARLRERLGLMANRRYIVFVGSALLRKGIDVAVRAFIDTARRLDDVDLLVVGEADFDDQSRHGTTRRDVVAGLKNELRQAGCDARVHWVGLVDNVQEHLQAADVFFFPTRLEGLPNVVAEAMAVGLPIVASHVDGVTTDMIDSGTSGILVSGYEPGDYSRALVALLQDPDAMQSFGMAAYERMKSEYQLDAIIDRYSDVYENHST